MLYNWSSTEIFIDIFFTVNMFYSGGSFLAKWLIIATWEEISPFPDQNPPTCPTTFPAFNRRVSIESFGFNTNVQRQVYYIEVERYVLVIHNYIVVTRCMRPYRS